MLWLALVACDGAIDTMPTPTSTPTGLPAPTGAPTPNERDPWVQITPAPCARTRSGRVQCWSAAAWTLDPTDWRHAPLPEIHVLIRNLWAEDSGVVWGITTNGDYERFLCAVDIQSPGSTAWCQVPEREGRPFTQIGMAFGLSDGVLTTWQDDVAAPVNRFPQDIGYRLIGRSRHLIALDTGNTLHLNSYSEDEPRSHDFPASTHIEAVLPWRGPELFGPPERTLGCALDDTGTITCVDGSATLPEQPFTDPPYIALVGEGFSEICAQRADHVIECTDGTTHDFGPTRSITATVTSEWPDYHADVCAITEAGAIVCEGRRYPQDLIDQLPTEDPPLEP